MRMIAITTGSLLEYSSAAIIYTGTRVLHLARNIVALPWTIL